STPIASWLELISYVKVRAGEAARFTVQRGGEKLVLPVTIGATEDGGETVGRIGIEMPMQFAPEDIEALRIERRYGVLESLPKAVVKTWEMTALTLKFMGHMLVGEVSPKNMSGPIAIGDFAGESARAGFKAFISFLAVVSL